jgi:GTP-binding protein
MLDFLAEVGVPTIVALTKIDKLRAQELPARVRDLALQLQLDEEQMIPFSATTNAGRDDLAAAVVSLVEQPSWRDDAEREPADSRSGEGEAPGGE